MNTELISLAKQFHLSVLSKGKFTSSYSNGEDMILSILLYTFHSKNSGWPNDI